VTNDASVQTVLYTHSRQRSRSPQNQTQTLAFILCPTCAEHHAPPPRYLWSVLQNRVLSGV